MKPDTVPIMRELPAEKQRVTKIQRRGNFLDVGDDGDRRARRPSFRRCPRQRRSIAWRWRAGWSTRTIR